MTLARITNNAARITLIAVLALCTVLFAAPRATAQGSQPTDAAHAAGNDPAHDHSHDGHSHDDHSHDAHGHEKAGVIPTVSQGIVPMIVAIFVFLVVFGVLSTVVWPKILGGLNDRADKIRSEIEAAEQARVEAKKQLDQYQSSLAEARAEAQRMLERTRAEQLALAADLKSRADAELAQMRDRAMKDIDAARKAAVADIYSEAANLATGVASKILRRNINAADQSALVEESIATMKSMRN
jgi:F-type H+-transporting ATPase subunit b